MSIALITGSCGLVGSESAIFFSKKGFDIVIHTSRNMRTYNGNIGYINLNTIPVIELHLLWETVC